MGLGKDSLPRGGQGVGGSRAVAVAAGCEVAG